MEEAVWYKIIQILQQGGGGGVEPSPCDSTHKTQPQE